MDFYGGENVDLKALLELLKADDDPICVHQHVETLRQSISIADEKRLQDFPLNGYISRLIEVLGHTIMMDFQVETKCKCHVFSKVSTDNTTDMMYQNGHLFSRPLLTGIIPLSHRLTKMFIYQMPS